MEKLTRYKRQIFDVRELKFNSLTEAIKMTAPFKVPANRVLFDIEGKALKEGISYEFEDKGGIIVFSTDVNAVIDAKGFKAVVKGFFKTKFSTFLNRFKRHSKISNVLQSFNDVQAYSVGNFFRGKYFDRGTGKTYSEKSMSVEIIGIPTEMLVPIAEKIAIEFNQKEVLVKEYGTNRIYLVDVN